MDNMNPMDGKKDPTFNCPECGAVLSVETKDESDSEHKNLMPKKKMNTGNMPMDQLKSKISGPSATSPTPNPPGSTMSNLNSY